MYILLNQVMILENLLTKSFLEGFVQCSCRLQGITRYLFIVTCRKICARIGFYSTGKWALLQLTQRAQKKSSCKCCACAQAQAFYVQCITKMSSVTASRHESANFVRRTVEQRSVVVEQRRVVVEQRSVIVEQSIVVVLQRNVIIGQTWCRCGTVQCSRGTNMAQSWNSVVKS